MEDIKIHRIIFVAFMHTNENGPHAAKKKVVQLSQLNHCTILRPHSLALCLWLRLSVMSVSGFCVMNIYLYLYT